MRVFVDVGAHFGECIFKALNPSLGFDLILAFEPSSQAVKKIEEIKDSRIKVRNCALGASTERRTLYGAGLLGASVYAEKKGNTSVPSETILVRNASEELQKYLNSSNEVFIKLNCEGSEIEILQNLIDSGLMNHIDHIYVDWDARKIPSLQEGYVVFRKLLEENYNITSADKFSVQGWLGVQIWLGEFIKSEISLIEKFNYRTFSFLPLRPRFRELIKFYFPNTYLKMVQVKLLYLKLGVKK